MFYNPIFRWVTAFFIWVIPVCIFAAAAVVFEFPILVTFLGGMVIGVICTMFCMLWLDY